jgi:hypothetical protein
MQERVAMLAEKMKQRLQPYVDGDMAGFRMQVLLYPLSLALKWLPDHQYFQQSAACLASLEHCPAGVCTGSTAYPTIR